MPTAIAREIEQSLASLRQSWPESRWVPTDDLHVTLAFLGAIPADRLQLIEMALGRLAEWTPPFELELSGSGVFGGRGRQRVAWLGFGEGRNEVRDLAAAIGAALGMEPGSEARPHLTVARHVAPEAAAALGDRLHDRRTAWLVDELVLYRSHLGPPRSRYEALARWSIGREPRRPS